MENVKKNWVFVAVGGSVALLSSFVIYKLITKSKGNASFVALNPFSMAIPQSLS
jgi:uncharacterized membrane protein